MDFDSSDLVERDEHAQLARLHENYRALRTLFHCLSIALLILTGTFFIYLYREVVVVRRQTRELLKVVNDYDRSNTKVLIREFQSKMYQFAQDHPDFRPVYNKYYGPTPTATSTNKEPSSGTQTTNGSLQNFTR